jgi:hypothetical protein
LAWLKWQFLCHVGPTEVACFGLSSSTRDLLYLDDVLIVRQRATAGTVAFDDHAVADLFDAMADRGVPPSRFARVWLHTHPGSSVVPSGTDEVTFARSFGGCDWAVMAILGRTGRTSARLRFSTGPGSSVQIPTAVDWAGWPAAAVDVSLPFAVEDWRREYETLVEPVGRHLPVSCLDAGTSAFARSSPSTSTPEDSVPSTDTPSGRDARQRDLLPPQALARVHAVVVGVGSVGRPVALQLAAAGVPAMTLIDPDTVSAENLGCQGFWATDVGDPKVDAVANVCHQQFPGLDLRTKKERFRKASVKDWPRDKVHAVFLCVDSVEARKLVWEGVRGRAAFVADGRAAAEVVRVLASDHPSADLAYPRTLFPAAEAYRGSCTSKTTVYAATVAAGLMVGQYARWLRGLPVVPDQTLNLLAAELIVAGEGC